MKNKKIIKPKKQILQKLKQANIKNITSSFDKKSNTLKITLDFKGEKDV